MNDFVRDILLGICCIPLGFLLLIFHVQYEEVRTNMKIGALYEKLRWIVDDSEGKPRCLPLKWYIYNLHSHIKPQYRFNDLDSEELIDALLEKYIKERIKLFFQDRLSTNKDLMKLSCEEYFFYSLYGFLENHLNEDDSMEYGMVYHKLRYYVAIYCELNDGIHNMTKNRGGNSEERLEKIEAEILKRME